MSQTREPGESPAKIPVPHQRPEPDTEKIPDEPAEQPPEQPPEQPQTPTPPQDPPPETPGARAVTEAEIKVIRASAGSVSPAKARSKPRHKHRPHWLLRILPWLAIALVAFIIGWLVWSVIDDRSDMQDNGFTVAPPSALDVQEDAARHLKPLNDLEHNDRVWYSNGVCGFQEWASRDHEYAKIRCDKLAKKIQKVRTIKVVPVELKSAVAVT